MFFFFIVNISYSKNVKVDFSSGISIYHHLRFGFWLCRIFVAVQALIVASEGYSRVVVHGLLIAVASLAVDHPL